MGELIATPDPKPSQQKQKHGGGGPGILINEQSAADIERVIKARPSFDVAEDEQGSVTSDGESEEGRSPGERLRRKTVNRKELTHGSSENEQSDESWEEIRSHLSRDKKTRNPRDKTDRKGVRRQESPTSPKSQRKRSPSFNSQSPRESYRPGRRPTDISHAASERYKTKHSRDLPSCLRQTKPRATDPFIVKMRPYPASRSQT